MTKDEALKWMIDNKKLESQYPTMTYEQGFAHGYEAHRVEQALEQPSNMVTVPLDKLQDMQRRLKALEQPAQEVECSNHPDAPHGFCRDASHSAGRYVCECEGWEVEQPAQDYVLICKRCGDDLGIEYVPDEQATQEPVTLIKHENGNYSPKHQWQGLTDGEISKAYNKLYNDYESDNVGIGDFMLIYFAIEQALKEKNT